MAPLVVVCFADSEVDSHIVTVLGRMLPDFDVQDFEQVELALWDIGAPGLVNADKTLARAAFIVPFFSQALTAGSGSFEKKIMVLAEQAYLQQKLISVCFDYSPAPKRYESTIVADWTKLSPSLAIDELVKAIKAGGKLPSQSAPAYQLLDNRYRLGRKIGAGGMGDVYEATGTRTGATVAIKKRTAVDQEAVRGFRREAEILAGLNHPVIVKVTDFFDVGTDTYVVMEYVPGDDLGKIVEAGQRMALQDLIDRIGRPLLTGLAYLHRQKPPVIHRDIKPENLKLTPEGLKLLDFGLAKGGSGVVTQLVRRNTVMGFTPFYSPPEQLRGKDTDERSDIFAAAATLYALLAGEAPDDPPQPISGVVPDFINNALLKGMSRDPRQRQQTARELLVELVSVQSASTAQSAGSPIKREFNPPTHGRMDYALGLSTLKSIVSDASRAALLKLEAKLDANLKTDQLYGSTAETRAERAQIINELNILALPYGSSFNEMAMGATPK